MALLDFQTLALFAAAVAIGYAFVLGVQRIYFHPLSKFPGPKLAAATLWYEFYYDVVRDGRWVWRIKEMHDVYGPIVRINPHEIHIRDADFFQEVYAPTGGGKLRNKYQWFVNMAGAPGSMFSTANHDLHRLRRAPLNNFFSKKAVIELEPVIREKVQKLCGRFAQDAERSAVVRVDCAFMAVTMDVICRYCFGSDRGYLDQDNYGLEWKETINGAWQMGAMMRAFPGMIYIMARFPRGLANIMDPNMGRFLAWQDSVHDAVLPILEHRDDTEKDTRTIFHTLRDSDLPPEERKLQRLCDEGEIFTGAGSETTARTLATILYYLVTHPDCMKQLKEELTKAMPDAQALASWNTLEQSPYLSAVIQEGLRLSYGITSRLPRVITETLQYKDWVIPPGTPVSETPYFVLIDPTIFPDPESFKPERWLQEGERLDRYQVSFNKGSRQCIGIK